MRVMLELKKEECKAKGEIPLEDIIRGIKTRNNKKTAMELAHQQTKLSSTLAIGVENLTRMEMLQKKKQMINVKIGIQDILKARRI